jgi:hypothetical protein
MPNPFFALSFQAARFGLQMQIVMALRLMRLMGGSASAHSEARRSISEEMAALPEAQTAATTYVAMPRHRNGPRPRALASTSRSRIYKKRGHANKRRFSK